MNPKTTLLSAVFFVVVGCGPTQSADEVALIPDAELEAIQVEQASTSTPTVESGQAETVTPGVAPFHLRLAWGYLAGNRQSPEWANWTGGARVTSGTMRLEHLTYFEGRDFPIPTRAPNSIAWRSRTLPHFDGVVARVAPGNASDGVTINLPNFDQSFDVTTLAAGMEKRFVVDAEGHELSISSVPANRCSGFSFGYMKAAPAGWLGFAGVVTNGRGQRIGHLRFRADNGVIHARAYIAKNLVAEGTGTLDAANKSFAINFTKLDGSPAGSVSGLYSEPSSSPRGSFQASGSGHCE